MKPQSEDVKPISRKFKNNFVVKSSMSYISSKIVLQVENTLVKFIFYQEPVLACIGQTTNCKNMSKPPSYPSKSDWIIKTAAWHKVAGKQTLIA